MADNIQLAVLLFRLKGRIVEKDNICFEKAKFGLSRNQLKIALFWPAF